MPAMRIAVDVMGGDHGCASVLVGVRLALESVKSLETVYLVGRESDIAPAVRETGLRDSRVQVINATEVMEMTDKPVDGVRRKKDSSVVRAIELVKDGKADAVISLGNTGGLLAASTIKLRPLQGLERPGIATVIPSDESQFLLLDAGANVECRPMHLVHYGILGSVYCREVLGVANPRVGLLSNGTEDNKGNELTREAFQLCKQVDFNFVGNVEGHGLFHNAVDVVVCDGFVGNIVLKTVESFARCLVGFLKKELTRNPKRALGALLARNALGAIKKRMDPDTYGGAPILGLNGIVIKAHASAKERAIMNAIRVATEAVNHQVNDTMTRELRAANERLDAMKTPPRTENPNE